MRGGATNDAIPVQIAQNTLPTPNPYLRTNVTQTTSRARQKLVAKLDQIIIPELFFDGLPLSEVVKFLMDETKRLDPEKKGVNFIINPFLDDVPSSAAGQGLQPIRVDLANAVVRINPPVRDLPAKHALDLVAKMTEPVGGVGVKYVIEDYAVVFSQKVTDPPQMFSRNFKVDPSIFRQGLESVGGTFIGGGAGGQPGQGGAGGQGGQGAGPGGVAIPRVNITPNNPGTGTGSGGARGGLGAATQPAGNEDTQQLARRYFASAGVNANTNDPTRAQIYYNDRTGVLMVRATTQDLNTISSALVAMHRSPVQIALEVVAVEVDPAKAGTLAASLNAQQRQQALERLKAGGARVSPLPKIITVSGREAHFELAAEADSTAYALLITPEVAKDDRNIMLKTQLLNSVMPAGTVDGQTAIVHLPNARHTDGRTLLLFITPTVVDPAGNRLNPEP
ncbi:MAG: hypothetical protein AB1705_20770 [Verrucomicrobiota bacterium]